MFVCLLTFFVTYYFLAYLLADLPTSSRIGPFCFQAGIRRRRPNLAVVFWGSFFVLIYFVVDARLLLCLI